MTRFMKNAALCAVIAGILLPTSALAFRAQNTLKVNPEGQGQFEVIQRGGVSPGDIWCAAGDYAMRVLGVQGTQRVYLVEGKHIARTEERRRFGYSFSLTPPPEAQNFTSSPLTLSLRAIGDSLSAVTAQQYCYDRLGEPKRLWP
ncbi:hypothetical protein [Aestuariivita boseongensis]|uniref:hypothetical protein n=1 Tax=Aestuariivita boseongensis TaxID=1470562 RepID=UPI000681965E|nr:hypothetical protein [Aestuariivita boseongensis]